MGSSGAGKTTLLNILSNQLSNKRGTKLEGEVLINDELKVTNKNFGSFAAYVQQDDYLFPSFT
jgi:ABC-type multidrug transport system ATPase subunit